MKRYWKCTVCGDIHYGEHPPAECPTCNTPEAYVEITKEEAVAALGL